MPKPKTSLSRRAPQLRAGTTRLQAIVAHEFPFNVPRPVGAIYVADDEYASCLVHWGVARVAPDDADAAVEDSAPVGAR